MTVSHYFGRKHICFYLQDLICISNNQKKRSLRERSLKIDSNQVFPCFHLNKSIPPTHKPNITLKFKICNA